MKTCPRCGGPISRPRSVEVRFTREIDVTFDFKKGADWEWKFLKNALPVPEEVLR